MQHLFHYFYSTTYSITFVLFFLFLSVTPADTIYQSIRESQLQNVFIVAGAYILAGLLVLFLYGSRLYSGRAVLAGIPKFYIPLEAADLSLKIRQFILSQLERSALITWISRPRDLRPEKEINAFAEKARSLATKGSKVSGKHDEVDWKLRQPGPQVDSANPPWGTIKHQGWSTPLCDDFPNLQLSRIICELPNLIEAQAVSAISTKGNIKDDICDDAIQSQKNHRQLSKIIQRSTGMDLQEYLGRLVKFGIIKEGTTVARFTRRYELARFSSEEISEVHFRELISLFSSMLSGMVNLDLSMSFISTKADNYS